MTWLSTGQLAGLEGVTSQTIRRWIKDGKYEQTKITEGGQLRIAVSHRTVLGYARVSSAKQKSSLISQSQRIQEAYPGIEVVADIASGFNFKRRGFRTILERCLCGDAIDVVVSNRDRLARTGIEFIEFVVTAHGGSIITLDPSDDKREGFDTDLLVGFITSFCNSYYGKRSGRRKKDQDLP